jgi:hypothetical protein
MDLLTTIHTTWNYEVLLVSSRTRQKKKYWLNVLNFGCHLLLGNVYSDTIIFSTLQKHRESHFP